MTFLGHYAEEAFEYFKEHPAAVIKTSAGLVAVLASGNILPLGIGMTGVFKAVSSFGKS